MPQTAAPTRRLALLADPDRAWKFDSLLPLLSPHRSDVLTTADLLSGRLSHADVAAYDLVFIKTKEEPALSWLRQADALGARLINPLDAISHSKDRARATRAAAAAGVPVPADFSGPLRDVPFPRFVLKSPHDHDDDAIPSAITSPSQRDAALLALGPDAPVYAQEYIDTEWELKLYCIGPDVFGFRQHPILANPDKHASRHPFDVSPRLAAFARLTLEAVGLVVGGVDFLGSLDHPRMTDVNSTQGLQSFPQGYAALARFFERCLATP